MCAVTGAVVGAIGAAGSAVGSAGGAVGAVSAVVIVVVIVIIIVVVIVVVFVNYAVCHSREKLRAKIASHGTKCIVHWTKVVEEWCIVVMVTVRDINVLISVRNHVQRTSKEPRKIAPRARAIAVGRIGKRNRKIRVVAPRIHLGPNVGVPRTARVTRISA